MRRRGAAIQRVPSSTGPRRHLILQSLYICCLKRSSLHTVPYTFVHTHLPCPALLSLHIRCLTRFPLYICPALHFCPYALAPPYRGGSRLTCLRAAECRTLFRAYLARLKEYKALLRANLIEYRALLEARLIEYRALSRLCSQCEKRMVAQHKSHSKWL